MSENQITQEELTLLIEQTYKVEKEFTELKQSYDHLQGTVEKVVEFLPNAIWILNENGEVFLQNSKARELWQLFELMEFRDDDYELNFEDRSYIVKSSTHKDKKMFSCTDITEQKRRENLATMGQMAAHLSHEIRNPIGSISLLSSTLKKRVLPENIPIVDEIQKSIFKIERIIKATLMFSKGIRINKKVFKFSKLREHLINDCGSYGYSKEISFIMPENDFEIDGDIDLLEILFSNFLFNAIDAIELDDEDTGVIELVYRYEDNTHKFYVYDSGVPIENKKELFEAFKSTKVKGNGLGLVLSAQIAEAHGGKVELLDTNKKGFGIYIA
ncbi:PAS domain-containing sensor histidine kinase [Sulfurimonas sp.]|uniref:sensor histidine kinase n=1 Tax=Sulfurimonas sp. TaxID=2022749 RepID=UPI00356360A4